jgi:transposase-like protein
MKTFKSIIELVTYFKDEATCRSYLEEVLWNGKPICPHCASDKHYKFKNSHVYKCANNQCYKKFTVTVGTIFDSSKLSLVKWFMAMYLNTAHKKGISSYQLGRDINVTQDTAWYMLHRIREGARDKSFTKLYGTVEVDETYLGKRRIESKKVVDQKPIMGAVVRDKYNSKVVMQPLNKLTVSSNDTLDFIKKNVEQDSLVYTDGSHLYKWMGYMYSQIKYHHYSVNHSAKEWTRGTIHTNSVENAFGLFKWTLEGTYKHVTAKHLARYCDEFSFRYNTRKMRSDERFELVLSQCKSVLRYKDLIGKQ